MGNCKQICPYTRIISYSVQLITPFLTKSGCGAYFARHWAAFSVMSISSFFWSSKAVFIRE